MNDKEKTYLQGLIDAWELARTVALPSIKGGMRFEDLNECFGMSRHDVFNLPVSQAKSMYDDWRAEEEINIGDEVVSDTLSGRKMVVISKTPETFGLIALSDGKQLTSHKTFLKKTGKHYDLPWAD